MPTPDRWYQHVRAATALVPCQDEEHRVTWRWGKLKLEDHDLGSERAMLVLGAEPCPCLRALQLWGDQFGMRPEQFGEMRRRLGSDARLLPQEFDIPREASMALSLERAWRQSRYFGKQGELLQRQLRERAVPVIRAHLTAEKQRIGSRMIRSVQLRHVPAGQPPEMQGLMDSVSVSATVTLSSDWLVNVWSRGLGVVDGAFVLEVVGPGSAPRSAAVRAVRWRQTRRGAAEPAVVASVVVPAGDGWRLTEPESAR